MHENDINRMIAQARKIADGLSEGGWNASAEVIRSLCRSRVAARETNRRLKQDNDALRKDMAQLAADLDRLKGRA